MIIFSFNPSGSPTNLADSWACRLRGIGSSGLNHRDGKLTPSQHLNLEYPNMILLSESQDSEKISRPNSEIQFPYTFRDPEGGRNLFIFPDLLFRCLCSKTWWSSKWVPIWSESRFYDASSLAGSTIKSITKPVILTLYSNDKDFDVHTENNV
jgi:hypothetical protein